MEKEIARIKSELADIGCRFTFGKTCEEKVAEIFEKSIDKHPKGCYNKGIKEMRETMVSPI